jgi:hypothetical protein
MYRYRLQINWEIKKIYLHIIVADSDVVFSVFKRFLFLFVLMLSTVSVAVIYLCPMFNMWVEYLELLLLFLIVYVCSYLKQNVLPISDIFVSIV